MFNFTLSKKFGFSLIELMIVILIISIIAMFSMPTYKKHFLQSKRLEAKTALYDLANRLENYFAIANTYEGASIKSDKVTDILTNAVTENKAYILKIITANRKSFIIQAALKNSNLDQACQVFTLTNTGNKSALGNNPNSCW